MAYLKRNSGNEEAKELLMIDNLTGEPLSVKTTDVIAPGFNEFGVNFTTSHKFGKLY